MCKYPEVVVNLSGAHSPFAVAARTITAMREAGLPEDAVTQYADSAMFGDYDHLLTITRDTVTTEE